TATIEANSSTFFMTNIIPQAPYNNEFTWMNMENYARTLIDAGDELYTIMGSYGMGGTGSDGTKTTIDNGHVTVPSNIWKVIVVLPLNTNDLSRVNNNTRVISVIIPNINTGLSSDWKTYRTSVDAIEAAAGLDLLSNISTAIQQVIEARVDNQ
ncbi:MAG: DNA/RNA non-specific endonuclease, partial [Parafilimonas sp.]